MRSDLVTGQTRIMNPKGPDGKHAIVGNKLGRPNLRNFRTHTCRVFDRFFEDALSPDHPHVRTRHRRLGIRKSRVERRFHGNAGVVDFCAFSTQHDTRASIERSGKRFPRSSAHDDDPTKRQASKMFQIRRNAPSHPPFVSDSTRQWVYGGYNAERAHSKAYTKAEKIVGSCIFPMPNHNGKTNTLFYVGIGVAVIIVIFGLWYFSRQGSQRRRPSRPSRPERPSRPGEEADTEEDSD